MSAVHHIALEIREQDADAEVAFWALLGFAEVVPPPSLGAGRARWVERDGTQLHLFHADAPVIPPQGHVAVVAPDYAAATTMLRERGFDVGERSPHWGAERCFVSSPAGHRVELMAFPPPRMP